MPFPAIAPFTPDSPEALKRARLGGFLRFLDGQVVAYVGSDRAGVVDSEEIKQHLAAGGAVGYYVEESGQGMVVVCRVG